MFGLDAFVSFLGGQASALNVASTLFNIYGGYQKAQQTSAMYEYEAAKQTQAAALSEATAGVAADKQRLAGKRQASAINAEYGAAGVDPTSGSAAVVGGELSRRVELDALSTILEGKYKAYGYNVAAAESKAAATNARNSSIWNTSSSLLGGLTRNAALSKWGNKNRLNDQWIDAGTPSTAGMG